MKRTRLCPQLLRFRVRVTRAVGAGGLPGGDPGGVAGAAAACETLGAVTEPQFPARGSGPCTAASATPHPESWALTQGAPEPQMSVRL